MNPHFPLPCSNNTIQQLLPGISALQSLRMLDLSDNPLGPSLPDDVAQLPSLASFNCSSCGLQALPDTLGGSQQPKLSSVNVSGNALVCAGTWRGGIGGWQGGGKSGMTVTGFAGQQGYLCSMSVLVVQLFSVSAASGHYACCCDE
jgi:hypothetical protein